jgi:hypothetical protein
MTFALRRLLLHWIGFDPVKRFSDLCSRPSRRERWREDTGSPKDPIAKRLPIKRVRASLATGLPLQQAQEAFERFGLSMVPALSKTR